MAEYLPTFIMVKIVSASQAMSMRRSRRRPGRLVFLFPLLLLTIAIAYGYLTSNQPATLVLTARASGREISTIVSVNGRYYSTPTNLSLPQGLYSVTFADLQWYQTPAERSVTLFAGRTAYALGEYLPAPRVVTITSKGFDTTTITALHGVTPVTWTNRGNGTLILDGDSFNRAFLLPLQNFTYVYPASGTFMFWIDSTQIQGTVSVG